MRVDKSLLCIRHGVTEMNVYLSGCPYGSPGFVDPGLFDTRLTAAGEALAASQLRKDLAAAHERDPIELVVSSPLTRAICWKGNVSKVIESSLMASTIFGFVKANERCGRVVHA